ncbi:GSCFA domain-containing protein [Legionella lytica]|uniref:GSCFA domain-containing protein n=1 Tax=Legionella lytica TaxID=96232 RepID=A0ABW8DA80_9GAMM
MKKVFKSTQMFNLTDEESQLILQGFSKIEPHGRWTDGKLAKISIPLPECSPRHLLLAFELTSFVPPPLKKQRVDICVNGKNYKSWFLEKNNKETKMLYVNLSEQEIKNKQININFKLPDCCQPMVFSNSTDDRYLSFSLFKITVSQCSELDISKALKEDCGPIIVRHHPYTELLDFQFWRPSVSDVPTHRVDPVISTRFKISKTARIGTAGSCFAQHIANNLTKMGFNYFITESGAHLPESIRRENNYGIFSARFGNIYTTAQLLQLFDEAFGFYSPTEQAWVHRDGYFIDPYRQQVVPAGFESVSSLLMDRQAHLSAVRQLFAECDIFIFTLGLTEAWRSKIDGAVFSAAPGVVAGEYAPSRYEFINFDLDGVYSPLENFLIKLKHINSSAKVLLTVSPVPLIATYENRSVLVSTTYSKSVLRVAAENAIKRFDWVDYFPSFEIITSSFSGGLYYEKNWREVNALGIAHVMRCFTKHYLENSPISDRDGPIAYTASQDNIICDEEIMNSIHI